MAGSIIVQRYECYILEVWEGRYCWVRCIDKTWGSADWECQFPKARLPECYRSAPEPGQVFRWEITVTGEAIIEAWCGPWTPTELEQLETEVAQLRMLLDWE